MIGPLKRWWAERGGMPDSLRKELEAEGLELLEERMQGRVTYRNYVVVGQRPASADQKTIVSLGLTPKRLVIRGTQSVRFEAPPGPVTSALKDDGLLVLRFEAGDLYPSRSGSVEMELSTPRAADIHARLQAWTQTSAS